MKGWTEKVRAFISGATSVLLRDPVERHDGLSYRAGRKVFAWESRYWQGAWVTSSGWVIRAYLDEFQMERVREAKEAEKAKRAKP